MTASRGHRAASARFNLEGNDMPVDLSLREGNLPETLAQLQEQVRKEPANVKHRIFLFQLLSVIGDWERANTQLSVVGEMDAGALAMVQTYREALKCEVLRAEIFAGKRSPVIFGQPASWLALLIEALRLTSENRYTEARDLREMAFDLDDGPTAGARSSPDAAMRRRASDVIRDTVNGLGTLHGFFPP